MDRYILVVSFCKSDNGLLGHSKCLEPLKQIYETLLEVSAQELKRGVSVFPGCYLNGSPSVQRWYFALQACQQFTQFCSSDWEELGKDHQNNEDEEKTSKTVDSLQRYLNNQDSVEQKSDQSALTQILEEAAEGLHLLSDKLPPPGKALLDVLVLGSVEQSPPVKDLLPLLGALKHMSCWHAAKITVVTQNISGWQKMASYLCATIMEPAELKNCIDHRELWRGSLVIREKKYASELCFDGFSLRFWGSSLLSQSAYTTTDHKLQSELISSDADGAIQRAGRFRVENGSSDETSDYTPATWRRTDVHLENPEYHTRWFFKYFLGKVHQNYVGTDAEKNPFFLSVVLSDQNNQRVPQYRAILWRKSGTLKISLPYSPTKTLSVKSILSAMNMDRFEKGPREILNPEIQKDLLVLEEQEGSVNFKFGVLYAKEGQLTDDEMFSNETGSESFDKFLGLLGDSVTLQGWVGYRGGLDTKNDTTGIKSIYTVYQGHELMFHVSTMLPYSKENKQQVERKRHIGNDIVTIVFQEGDDASSSFKPSMIRSHFTHIFALVRYNSQNNSYRLKIFSEESVPLFGPPLPSPPVFTDHQEFRDFLLVKLINGEKATLETPTFAQKRQRTLDMLIRSLYQDLMPDLHKNMLNRRSFSDVLPESPKSARKKEEARQAEFVRIGQALKLKTIVRGDAPTSLVNTGLCRKEPWESQLFCSTFPYEIVCADSWGQSLLAATDAAGVMLLDGLDPVLPNAETQSVPPVQVFDKTMVVKQMHVLEPQDLLITRADKGKDARLYVFRLRALRRGMEEKQLVRSKCDCRENKLEKTKGCHLYSINTHHGSELRIVAAIRNKLLLITRKHLRFEGLNAVASGPDSPVEEFQYIREICLCDPPVVMALVDGPTGENDNMICVAYKHQFDLINESTGDAYRLHHVEANRVNFVAAIDVYEDGEAGLLLCYNYICYYKKVCPFSGSTPMIHSNTSDFHFSWNQMPNATVCAFPYILAFTTDSIEIRLVVNGNLVYTAVVPELQLAASRSDIYFVSSAPVSSASNCSSRDTSSQSSPQTPTGYEMPVFPSPLGDDSIRIPYGTKLSLYMSKDAEGESACKHIFKIPLCNLVGRSIERPLKSPLVNKVLTTPAPITAPPTPLISATHSLSLSRMEIKEIASRTRKELLGLTEEPSGKSDSGTVKQRKMSKKNTEEEPKARVLTSTNSDRLASESADSDLDVQLHCSSSLEADLEAAVLQPESPPLASAFAVPTSFEEDILDLK